MFVSDALNVNEKGHLTIGGVDTIDIAEQFGTPCYVFDENQIRENCRSFVKSIEENYDGNGLVCYASKAFCCKEMCRICDEEKMGLDVVSGGELFTAIQAGFPMGKVIFHGNNKTYDELLMAVQNNVGRIIVDNFTELEILEEIAKEKNITVPVLLRIKPGIEVHTHEFVRTGQIDSKFGFALETGEAMEAVARTLNAKFLELRGVHCHIGSQVFEIDPFKLASSVMAKFIRQIRDETGVEMKELNLGGGFGIKYLTTDNPEKFYEYVRCVSVVLKRECEKQEIKIPFILFEPGRSIVGAEGITLYTAGVVKKIPNIRTYVSIDGGMADNPRYILYQAEHEIMVANKAGWEKDCAITLAGKCCESGDLIAENAPIQRVHVGDIIAVLSTGAYNYSMASNYNRLPRPSAIMVKDGECREIIKRETYLDLIRNDI
jgi:diaminopimelate decarboxylase